METLVPAGQLQPPSWRWDLAVDLTRDGGMYRPCAEPAVRAAKRFWLAWRKCRADYDRQLLAGRLPTVAAAFAIHHDARLELRHAIEARVLAAEPLTAIAQKSGISAEVVQTYELLFFDVRRHLQSPDYVLHHVLGLPGSAGTSWTYGRLWKCFAFFGGVHVLEDVMGICGAGTRPASASEVAPFLAADARATVARQAALAARSLIAVDAHLAAELIKIVARPLGARPDPEEATTQNQYTKHIAAMLKEIPWISGAAGEENLPPELKAFDDAAAELRTDELLQVASGKTPEGLEEIRNLQLPPPRRKSGGTSELGSETDPLETPAPTKGTPKASPGAAPPEAKSARAR